MANLNTLTDAELDQVYGGMDCKAAVGLAGVYLSIANVNAALGFKEAAAADTGRAQGVLTASCPK